ncbi:hypothetical protein CRG98_037855 [Punica granatum]|uniref:Uncharacterized protein n=1 Tax=Punica granatum TaxID=22663 RepID=A0A2I0ICP3_PUNGR|nr:hypothetical protein CRG98_037855 [Punica granatum]
MESNRIKQTEALSDSAFQKFLSMLDDNNERLTEKGKIANKNHLSGEHDGATGLLDFLLGGLGHELGLYHNRLLLWQKALPDDLEVPELSETKKNRTAKRIVDAWTVERWRILQFLLLTVEPWRAWRRNQRRKGLRVRNLGLQQEVRNGKARMKTRREEFQN